MKCLWAFWLASAMLVPFSGQAQVRVGVTTSLTGPGASIGIPTKNALDFWPKNIAGQDIHIQVLDDAGDPTVATKNAWRFATDGFDVIVGAANTPAAIAVAKVAKETKTPQLAPSPAELPKGEDHWTFRVVMPASFYIQAMLEDMAKHQVKTVGFIGLSDAYGESHLQALKEQAASHEIELVATERFSRADSSVAGQALSIVAKKPDAVIAIAVGGGAALPQKALKDRGYKGRIYHTAASVSPDFLRLAGKDAEGALVVSGPEQVPEQLADDHPGKQTSLKFVALYEDKYGAGSRTQFAANAYDLGLVMEKIVPQALNEAAPGTPEFRTALRNALETQGDIIVTKGPLRYTQDDHWGFGPYARVLITPDMQGGWNLVP